MQNQTSNSNSDYDFVDGMWIKLSDPHMFDQIPDTKFDINVADNSSDIESICELYTDAHYSIINKTSIEQESPFQNLQDTLEELQNQNILCNKAVFDFIKQQVQDVILQINSGCDIDYIANNASIVLQNIHNAKSGNIVSQMTELIPQPHNNFMVENTSFGNHGLISDLFANYDFQHEEAPQNVPDTEILNVQDINEESDLEIPDGVLDEESDLEIPDGVLDDEPDLEIPDGVLDDEPNLEIPDGLLNEESGIEIPDGVLDDEQNLEIPDGVLDNEPDIEIPNGVLDEGPNFEI